MIKVSVIIPVYNEDAYALKEKVFEEFNILGHPEDFYYNRRNYLQMRSIMEMDLEECLNQKIKYEQQYFRSTGEITALKTRIEEQRHKSDEKITSLKTKMEEQRRKSSEKILKKNEEILVLKGKNKKLKSNIEELRNSLSFKVGRAITYIPCKIRDFLKK